MNTILTLNPGSSSLKASVRTPQPILAIGVERIGTDRAGITTSPNGQAQPFAGDLPEAVAAIAAELRSRGTHLDAVAHRVVHGGPHRLRPALVDEALLADLRAAIPLAPLHLPGALATIEQARRSWPGVAQVACFDTGFHADLPTRSSRLPVPAELVELGVRRYGFHGLSVQSVLQQHPELDQVVIAHLGSGCSVTSVADGRPRHTTMSLTPTGGMVSGTRTGDLDPEIVLYLIEQHGYQVKQLRDAFDHRSGLAGVADGRHDLRDLLEATDPAAGLALDIFLDSAAMAIAACATTLDHWQALVFTGGIGEHAPPVRERICRRLLTIRGGTSNHAADGSVERLQTTGLRVLVVPADEEAVLDGSARQLLAD